MVGAWVGAGASCHNPTLTASTTIRLNSKFRKVRGRQVLRYPTSIPFWIYCAYFWASHAYDETFFNDDKALDEALTLYSSENPRFAWAAVALQSSLEIDQDFEIQHVAALNNHVGFLKKLWESSDTTKSSNRNLS